MQEVTWLVEHSTAGVSSREKLERRSESSPLARPSTVHLLRLAASSRKPVSYACWTRNKVLHRERALTIPYHEGLAIYVSWKPRRMGGLSGEEARKLHVPFQQDDKDDKGHAAHCE